MSAEAILIIWVLCLAVAGVIVLTVLIRRDERRRWYLNKSIRYNGEDFMVIDFEATTMTACLATGHGTFIYVGKDELDRMMFANELLGTAWPKQKEGTDGKTKLHEE